MFPSNKEMNERWKPHTGHSIPNICLYGQGSDDLTKNQMPVH